MATPNPRPQSVIPQAKVSTLQSIRNESKAELSRRECLNFGALEDGLNVIRADSEVLHYTGEGCQGRGERLTIIAAGLGQALKVAHDHMAREIEVE